MVMGGSTRSGCGFMFRRNQHEFKEVKTWIIKSSKAKELLNWDSKFKLSTVVEKIYNWENYHQKKQDSKYSLKEVEEFFSK